MKFSIFLFLAFSMPLLAQDQSEEDFLENEQMSEVESFIERQEEFIYPPINVNESNEDFIAEEEVYDSEADY